MNEFNLADLQRQLSAGVDKPKDQPTGKPPEAKPQQPPTGKPPEAKPQQPPTGNQQVKPNNPQQTQQAAKGKKPNIWMKLVVPYFVLITVAIAFVCTMFWVEGGFTGLMKSALELLVIFVFTVPAVAFLMVFGLSWFFPAFLLLAVVWTFGLCFENYWLVINPSAQAFVPKWFIDDGWNLKNLFKPETYLSLGFWVTLVFVALLQALEARGLRLLGWGKNGRKTSNGRMAAIWGFATLFCLGIDIATGLPHYPLSFGMGLGKFAINFVYLVLSVVMTEILANLLLNTLEE
jgi:hypothetical protein